MASLETLEIKAEPPVVFRPGKKRKAFRKRIEEDEPTDSNADATPTTSTPQPVAANGAPASGDQDSDDDQGAGGGLSVAEVIRRRNARKQRHGGVAFRATPFSQPDSVIPDNSHNNEQGMVLHDDTAANPEESAIIGGITKRFAPQTGLVGELVNRNM